MSDAGAPLNAARESHCQPPPMIGSEAAPSRTVGKGPVVGSACVHTVAIFLVWWASAAPRGVPDFPVFEIELISPPAAELGEPTPPPPPDELVITTPLDPAPERQEEDPCADH